MHNFTHTMLTRNSIVNLLLILSPLAAGSIGQAHAQKVTQTFKATVGGAVLESDDKGILLVPLPGSFSLSASTQGFSSYPPPPGLSDRLMVSCSSSDLKPRKYAAGEFRGSRCNASFTKGRSNQVLGKPVAQYESRRDASIQNSFIEITSASGKVIEGRFLVELVPEGSPKGTKAIIAEGTFKAEDRQRK